MKIKYYIIRIFSMIFALFIALNLYLCQLLVFLTSRLRLADYTNFHLRNRELKIKRGKKKISEYIQIVANSSISLMFSLTVLNYHQHFIYIILLVSHHVHHWFINFIMQVPDYSIIMQNILSYKGILFYLYIIYGYVGLSAQITLTVDCIYLFNMPTILIYKILAIIYQFLLRIVKVMNNLLSINEAYWLTCPYPSFLLRDGMKIIYIAMVPVLAYLLIIIVFYYLWLAVVIVCLKIFINIGINLALFTQQIGCILCVIKGIILQEQTVQNNNLKSKLQNVIYIIQNIKWKRIIKYEMIVSIFQGKDLFDDIGIGKTKTDINFINFTDIYRNMVQLEHHNMIYLYPIN